jgi:hypothetical protein
MIFERGVSVGGREWSAALSILGSLAVSLTWAHHPRADQAGLSFWLPGLYGSLAAVPSQPGWSFAGVGYFSSVSAGADKAFPRGARVDAGLDAHINLGLFNATYVFANPVLGAQAAVGTMSIVGRTRSTIDATLTGPNGGVLSGSRTDTVSGFGDLYPIATLKWNQGVIS